MSDDPPPTPRLVRSKRWRRQTDNHGAVRVLVPAEAINRAAENPRAELNRLVGVLEAAIAALRERTSAADSRADAAEARAATLQTEVEALRQADAARKGRGRLARLRAAWRGSDNLTGRVGARGVAAARSRYWQHLGRADSGTTPRPGGDVTGAAPE